MADAFTVQGSVASDTTAYQALAYFALRQELIADQFADVRATNQTHRGAAVTFFKYDDLTTVTSALTETTDPDSVALSDAVVTVTLGEYGNSVRTSAKLRGTSLLDVLRDAANIIGFNAGKSVDEIEMAALAGGSNVYYSNVSSGDVASSNATIQAGDTFDSSQVRKAVAKMRSNNVMTRGGSYVGLIHPYIAADYMATTTAGWRDPKTYSDPSGIYNAELGTFEGVRWVASNSAKLVGTGAGSGSIDVFHTLILGQQALAKGTSSAEGFGENPSVFEIPVVDKLKRFRGIGWYHLFGVSRFREQAIYRLTSSTAVS